MEGLVKVSALYATEGFKNSLVVSFPSTTGPGYSVVYGTQQGHVFLKTDSGVYSSSLNSSVSTFAQADGENQLLWTNSSGNLCGGVLSVNHSTTFVQIKEVVHQNSKLYIRLKQLRSSRKTEIESSASCRII